MCSNTNMLFESNLILISRPIYMCKQGKETAQWFLVNTKLLRIKDLLEQWIIKEKGEAHVDDIDNK